MRKLPRKPDPLEQWAAAQDAVRLAGDADVWQAVVRAAVKRSGLSTAEIARRAGLGLLRVQRIVGYGVLFEAHGPSRGPGLRVRDLVRVLDACGAELLLRWPQLGSRR